MTAGSAHFANGRVKLLGSGSALPGRPVDNKTLLAHLAQRCGATTARKAKIIAHRLGIVSRHLCRDLKTAISTPDPDSPELCAEAINAAMAQNKLDGSTDYLIGHTTSPHTLLPPNIAWVADRLEHAGPYLELRQACTGFANALQIAVPMLASNSAMRSIVIVGSEVGSVYFDMSADFIDRQQLVNFVQMGDGAGAVVVGPDDGTNSSMISDVYIGHSGLGIEPGFYIQGGGSGDVVCNHGLPVFRHDATQVRERAGQLFLHGLQAILGRGYALDDFAYILPHQVNGRMGKLMSEALDVPVSRIVVDADILGNLGSAAIWVSLDRLRRSGRLEPGDKVLVLGAEASKYLYGGFIYHC